MVCGGFRRSPAQTAAAPNSGVQTRHSSRFEQRVRHHQLNRPVRRMPLELAAAAVVDRHEERQPSGPQPGRGRRAESPARGSCPRRQRRRQDPAVDPMRLSAQPIPEAAGQPATVLANREPDPGGGEELQRDLAAARPAGRSPGPATSTRTYSRLGVEPEVDQRDGPTRRRSVWCIAPATSRTSSVPAPSHSK